MEIEITFKYRGVTYSQKDELKTKEDLDNLIGRLKASIDILIK